MNRYIEQLIEDIRKAAELAPEPDYTATDPDEDEALEQHFADVERYISGETDGTLATITGIVTEILPQPEKLTPAQLNRLVNELVTMLNKWNYYPEFPDNLPDDLKYLALLGIWDEEHPYTESGMIHLDFCNYDPENCPFTGYCTVCEEVANDDMAEIESLDTDEDDGDFLDDLDDVRDLLPTNEQIAEVTNTPAGDFIPGIFNYCDRWCERCDFTDRCQNYSFLNEIMKELDERERITGVSSNLEEDEPDFADEDFDFFPSASDMDDDDLNEENDFFSAHQKSGRHPLVALSEAHSEQAHKWQTRHYTGFEKNLTYWLAKGYADDMSNAFEIFSYYNHFIHMKLQRAVNGYFEQEEFHNAAIDMNGSAKVALIALDRSLAAVNLLKRYLKAERATLKKFHHTLEKIRYMAEETFPEARSFIRPGLDE